ncbi:hypothetical protein E4U25_007099, partial [Claviceps purpurea]
VAGAAESRSVRARAAADSSQAVSSKSVATREGIRALQSGFTCFKNELDPKAALFVKEETAGNVEET